MINQKGQAFSVFELMIAGVVAFAILMVLLSIIDINPGYSDEAVDSISNAITSAKPSGQSSTESFLLKKDVLVMSTNLASKTDLDKSSFIFTMGEFTDADKIETDGTYLKYLGPNGEKTISATVICEQTNEDLQVALGLLDSSKKNVDLAADGCPDDGIVCCVIIPTRYTGN